MYAQFIYSSSFALYPYVSTQLYLHILIFVSAILHQTYLIRSTIYITVRH